MKPTVRTSGVTLGEVTATDEALPPAAKNERIRRGPARTILSPTCGFIASAGFTHSLSPARNCTYGCLYCYVPTMRVQAGLRPEDWRGWGAFTTYKENAPELLRKALREEQRIYCSPLTDPYQPAEATEKMMPRLLEALIERPPAVFALQTRGPLILRDLPLLGRLAERTRLQVSFSITTDREEVRRRYEPHCESIAERLAVVGGLRAAGIAVHVTLAPLLPCDPEALARLALEATELDVIADPLHTRASKKRGATTRDAAVRLSERRGEQGWLEPERQAAALARIREVVEGAGRRFGVGAEAFGWLAE